MALPAELSGRWCRNRAELLRDTRGIRLCDCVFVALNMRAAIDDLAQPREETPRSSRASKYVQHQCRPQIQIERDEAVRPAESPEHNMVKLVARLN